MLYSLIFILCCSSVLAYVYKIDYECQEEDCIEGQEINWSIHFENKGELPLMITSIELVDGFNKSVLANLEYVYDPFNSEKNDYLRVVTGKTKTAHIIAKIPKPNLENELIYVPCFTNIIDSTDAKDIGTHLYKHCFTKNESITIFECTRDNHCGAKYECKSNKCERIRCGYCQMITDHECKDYECCSNEVCGEREGCINHKCIALDCSPKERIFNHSCVELECKKDEYIENQTCLPLSCENGEYPVNHRCIQLNCSYDENVVNSTCTKLNCDGSEYAVNHTCKKLSCKYNETASNHACIGLNCGLFQKTSNHRCIIDRQFISKFSIELFIAVVVVLVLVLDIKKYESKQENKKEEFKKEKDISNKKKPKK